MSKDNKCECGGKIVMVEYSLMDKYHYDGVSEHMCIGECKKRTGRWCGKVLTAGEVEPRFCEGIKNHPRIFKIN